MGEAGFIMIRVTRAAVVKSRKVFSLTSPGFAISGTEAPLHSSLCVSEKGGLSTRLDR